MQAARVQAGPRAGVRAAPPPVLQAPLLTKDLLQAAVRAGARLRSAMKTQASSKHAWRQLQEEQGARGRVRAAPPAVLRGRRGRVVTGRLRAALRVQAAAGVAETEVGLGSGSGCHGR